MPAPSHAHECGHPTGYRERKTITRKITEDTPFSDEEWSGKAAALLMHYDVIVKMTGVYSHYFQNDASAIITLRGSEILKNPKGEFFGEETEEEVSESKGIILV